jgi:NAD(P)-dependent dehydrogenase (short-subunit alcohol dehydrogenase family)
MHARTKSLIIGISSVEGVRSVPLHAPYTAGKWALRALYDSPRVERAQEGAPIVVSTISPASIDTPFFEHARSKVGAMPKPLPPQQSHHHGLVNGVTGLRVYLGARNRCRYKCLKSPM